MGTGSYVNFGNGDDAFNIALDSAGHLNFLANDQGGSGSLRMAILDDTNEVIAFQYDQRAHGTETYEPSSAAASCVPGWWSRRRLAWARQPAHRDGRSRRRR